MMSRSRSVNCMGAIEGARLKRERRLDSIPEPYRHLDERRSGRELQFMASPELESSSVEATRCPSQRMRGAMMRNRGEPRCGGVRPREETPPMWTCAGVGVCQSKAPAERAPTRRHRRARGDHIVHEIHRQEVYRADGAN